MISIIKQEKDNGAVLLRGLAADEKPISVITFSTGQITLANGSEYECVDTGERYLYDAENEQWYQVADAKVILGVSSINGSKGSVTSELTATGDGDVTLGINTRGDE